MRKGIAVQYIIALILGVAVLGLIGYWFFVLGGRIPGEATTTWCQTRENRWCTTWARTGLFPYDKTEDEVTDEDWDDGAGGGFAPGCAAIGIAIPDADRCRTLLGVTTTV